MPLRIQNDLHLKLVQSDKSILDIATFSQNVHGSKKVAGCTLTHRIKFAVQLNPQKFIVFLSQDVIKITVHQSYNLALA